MVTYQISNIKNLVHPQIFLGDTNTHVAQDITRLYKKYMYNNCSLCIYDYIAIESWVLFGSNKTYQTIS